jgi:tetratricopeptide (TPR) repeat protein
MGRFLAVFFLFSASVFGQAAAGNEKFEQKQYTDAAKAYERIPAAQRTSETYARLGLSYHLGNQFKPAETAYQTAIRLKPGNALALNNLAALYYSQRKFSDAEREIRRALEKDPENNLMRSNLRAARYARENTKNARDVADTLAKDTPLLVKKVEGDALELQILMAPKDVDEASLHEKRGDSYFARKLYEDAVIEYQKSTKLDRYNASTLNRLGLVYHQIQKLNEAERYYREALKQNPYFVEVLNNIGTVEYARQHYESALDEYQRALKIRPESATVLLNMGACLFDLKRYDEAMKATQRALELDPKLLDRTAGFGTLIQMSRRNDPTVSFYYAKIYASQGEKERAISYLNRALDEGFTDYDKIRTDPVFRVLAMEEGYAKLLERITSLTTSNTPK